MERINNFVQTTSSDIEAVFRVDQQQEYRKVGSIKVRPGHTIYALDLTTGELEPLEYSEKPSAIDIATGERVSSKHALHKPNYVYISSLNIKNAKRKAEKLYDDIAIKLRLIKKNPHLIISNIPFWNRLQDIGFEEFSDSVRTVAGMQVVITMMDGKQESMLLLSIRPSLHKDLNEVYILSDGKNSYLIREKDLTHAIVLEYLLKSAEELLELLKRFNEKHTEKSKLTRVKPSSIEVLETMCDSLRKVLKSLRP